MPCAGQNESGRRFLSEELTKRKSIWYDSTLAETKCFEEHPIIRSIPPLNSGMPYDIMCAYIYLDSLARFYENPGMTSGDPALLEQPGMVKKLAAMNYMAVDYNPALFRQYDIETTLKSDIFKWFIGRFTEPLPKSIARIASNQREADALISTILPDYVLRVKVISIDSIPLARPSDIGRSRGGTYLYNVTAEVLDTLKGSVILPCIAHNNNYPPVLPASVRSCINFQFYSSNYFQDVVGWRFVEDSAFLTSSGGFTMHRGQEAVVFLKYFGMRYSYTHDYIGLAVDSRSSYNALPIINGKVHDVNRIWSDQLIIDYTDWRNRFMDMRTRILTGSY